MPTNSMGETITPVSSGHSSSYAFLSASKRCGRYLSMNTVAAKSIDCELWESKRVRSWSPAVYSTLRYYFQLTYCVGDSYIVAVPIFSYWFDTIPRDLAQFEDNGVLFNIYGHPELHFDIHALDDISIWIAFLPKYSVIVMTSSLHGPLCESRTSIDSGVRPLRM